MARLYWIRQRIREYLLDEELADRLVTLEPTWPNFADVDGPEFLIAVGPTEGTTDRRPNAPLVAAMCQFQLGQTDLARKMLARIQEHVKKLDSGFDPDKLSRGDSHSGIDHRLLGEAEQLFRSKPVKP